MYKTVLGCFLLALWVAGCATLRPMGGSGDREEQRQAMQYFIRAKVFESQGNFMAAIVALRNAADRLSMVRRCGMAERNERQGEPECYADSQRVSEVDSSLSTSKLASKLTSRPACYLLAY